MNDGIIRPTDISQLQEVVRKHARLSPNGGRTKSALQKRRDGITNLDLTGISGVMDYIPSEFTFTALAGTGLDELNQGLSDHEQYLPFDPPFVGQGATIGGAVASGLSGPGRFRYGGIRDFIIGIQYVDGQGNLIRSGGKVVKNAAGFDLSKLMVGSLGSYGALIECSFKVFPKPKILTTLQVSFTSIEGALEKMIAVTKLPMDIYAIDLIPKSGGCLLVMRLGGISESMTARIDRLQGFLGGGEIFEGEEESKMWREVTEFSWVHSEDILVKIPVTPKRVVELDKAISVWSVNRRYSIGCNVAWVSWSKSIEALDENLSKLGLSGLVIVGQVANPRLGVKTHNQFSRKVKEALDPANKWVEV